MGRFRYQFSNLCGSVHRGGNLCFSPDGSSLFSAVGGRLAVFDLVAAKSFTMPFECRADIAAIAVSPKDGSLVLVIDEDHRAILVNVSSRTVIHRFTLRERVRKDAVQFSPCQNYVAIGCGRRLEVWRVPPSGIPEFAPFERVAAISSHHDDITCVSWSHDSRYVVTGSRDLTARVCYIRAQTKRVSLGPRGQARIVPLTLFGHKDVVVFVSFLRCRDGDALVTLSRDGSLYCWHVQRNPAVQEQDRDPKESTDPAEVDDSIEQPQGEEPSSASDEHGADEIQEEAAAPAKQTRLVCMEARLSSKHNVKQGNARRVLCGALHEETGHLSVGLSNGVFAMYELPVDLTRPEREYVAALFAQTRTSAAYSDLDLLHALSMSSQAVSSLAVNRTGEWVAVGVATLGQLVVWEWRSESFVLKQQGHMLGGQSLAFSADGRALVTGGDDGRVKLWSVQSGFCTVTFSEHDAAVTCVAFSARDVVLSASLDGTVRAYDVRRYRCFRVLVGPPPRRQFATVTADSTGEVIAAGCRDTFEVVLWSLRTGRVLDVLSGHTGPVSSLAFHPSRGQLATGSWDATVRIWEVYSDTACEELKHDKEVLAVAYRPDGGELAVSTMNGEVTLWDPDAAQVKGSIDAGRDCAPGRLRDQRTVAAKRGFFRSVAYSADSQFLLGGGDSNYICAYHVGEGRDPALLQRFNVTINKNLDGVDRKISSKELTDAGVGGHAIEDFDSDDDLYREQKRRSLGLLPGVANDREKRRARTRCVRFSPTGGTWAAMTSEGLMLFSSDVQWKTEFDPTALDVEVTEQSVRAAMEAGDHTLALRTAIRLGDPKMLSDVVSSVPVEKIPTVVHTVPSQLFARLVILMARRLDPGVHLGFDLDFSRKLLLELGLRGKGNSNAVLGDPHFLSSLRALQRAITAHWNRISRLCDANSHLMDYILTQSHIQRDSNDGTEVPSMTPS